MKNKTGKDIISITEKTDEEIDLDREAFKEKERKVIEEKLSQYKKDQKKQLKNGGVGPVADFEIMKIVNEHKGKFDLEVEDLLEDEIKE